MAKILNGILGGGSGKVGGVIMSSWKGIDTLKAYAIPSNPQSAAQTTQRNKFTGILTFLQLILATVIQPYWDSFAVGMSGFNEAMRVNLLAWADDTAFDDAIIAQGSLESETLIASTYDPALGDVVMNWAMSGLGNGLTTDNVLAVIVDTVNNIAFVSEAAVRQDDVSEFNIGADRVAADLKFYLSFTRGSGETLIVANSTFVQPTAV